MSGCSEPASPPTFAVSGHVSLNRKPLNEGVIRFISPERSGDVTTTIQNGEYHFDQPSGPTAGDFDVVVTPVTPDLSDAQKAIEAGERDPLQVRAVPAKYQSPGELRATVAPDQENQFDFELRGR
ncbi:hypothetical protein CA85_12010 [Allorhodopirellula solitaria]|uniref:Carboxypeptidase regulatory-like domain-containing protein n=2 Tax=Allorhodopirellula solitaria TaxID=2527987 RepID=A0A5C5YGN4_9BACT|nr:hypothetical protein CA85_12010 [Allorhodopirellula solitaria]